MADLQPQRVIDRPGNARILRILFLEDNRFVRRALARSLRSLTNLRSSDGEPIRFEVVEAEEASAAFDLISAGEHFHLILTDFYMPVVSGYELIQRLRTANPATPMLVITAADHATFAEIPAAGADLALQKPIRNSDLLAPLTALLGLTAAPTPVSRLVWNAA